LAGALGAGQHLDLAEIRRALPPGTLLLSYAVLPARTVLFAVRAEGDGAAGDPGLDVFDVPLPADALAREVGVFRSLLASGRDGDAVGQALSEQARRLHGLLLGPAARLVDGAARLLIAADGPLQTLPFAALRGEDGAWLAEHKPVTFAPSATAWASMHARAPASHGPARLVAFADPSVPAPAGSVEDDGTRGGAGAPLVRYRHGLAALPFAREEARAVARAWPGPSAVFTGELATKARALGVGPGTRILHFATHALVDRRFPLDSGLALAWNGPDAFGEVSGLLQAWEVLESMKLDADLVTLSGCETGLGSEGSGEGLVGLVRAFQIAGARTVTASLWAVSDRSTKELMTRFYRGLARGLHKDDALREAQRALAAGEAGRAFTHPWHWAAFEVFGDGR
jgi:CHAT domain-containing protein